MPFTIGGGADYITVTGGTGTVTANNWKLARVRWVAPSAAGGNACKITDTLGNVFFDSTATGANFADEIEFGKVHTFLGVKVTVLDTGTIYFYLR